MWQLRRQARICLTAPLDEAAPDASSLEAEDHDALLLLEEARWRVQKGLPGIGKSRFATGESGNLRVHSFVLGGPVALKYAAVALIKNALSTSGHQNLELRVVERLLHPGKWRLYNTMATRRLSVFSSIYRED